MFYFHPNSKVPQSLLFAALLQSVCLSVRISLPRQSVSGYEHFHLSPTSFGLLSVFFVIGSDLDAWLRSENFHFPFPITTRAIVFSFASFPHFSERAFCRQLEARARFKEFPFSHLVGSSEMVLFVHWLNAIEGRCSVIFYGHLAIMYHWLLLSFAVPWFAFATDIVVNWLKRCYFVSACSIDDRISCLPSFHFFPSSDVHGHLVHVRFFTYCCYVHRLLLFF